MAKIPTSNPNMGITALRDIYILKRNSMKRNNYSKIIVKRCLAASLLVPVGFQCECWNIKQFLHDFLISLEPNYTWHQHYGCYRCTDVLICCVRTSIEFCVLSNTNWKQQNLVLFWWWHLLNTKQQRRQSLQLKLCTAHLGGGQPIRVFLWPMPIYRHQTSQWLMPMLLCCFGGFFGQYVGTISFFPLSIQSETLKLTMRHKSDQLYQTKVKIKCIFMLLACLLIA